MISEGARLLLEIVHLGNNSHDGIEVEAALRSGGIDAHLEQVHTEAAFREQLERPEIDLLLAASDCPGFSGAQVLVLAQQKRPELPLILLSAKLDHDEAKASLDRGATDFIFEEHLPQLVPAVRRVLREKEARRAIVDGKAQAEENLSSSDERLRRFIADSLTGNFIMRRDGVIQACNPAFARIFDFGSVEEAIGTNFMSLLRTRRDSVELLSHIQSQRTVEHYELEMRQPSGEAVYVVARFAGVFDRQDELVELQGFIFNDTKRKRLEQQLVQAQKMEGLGTLAGGIAHDFNNILAIILGYANQLEKNRARPESTATAIRVIKEAVERGAALVQQLLTSARQAEARLSSLDLNELIRELERMLQATFPKMINFELNLEPNFPLVTADRSQIHQVLLNLCVNARDAMPNGGTITIETSLTSGDQLEIYFTGAESKRYASIRVRDTGAGMTPDVKAHIFEPFFTTKERSKGTGLGLSVVYGVVNNHRGFVQVESEPGVGTTFSIYLPVMQARDQSDDADSAVARASWEPQTILLVEDEEMLRDLGIEIIESEGYRVLAAKDGLEAVEIFTAHRDEIGLVVCDLGLPKLGGREVFLRMKEIKPGVRAIVASGYLEPSMRSEILKAGVIDTIQKPYDFQELLERIRAVIGKAKSDDDHPQLF